jgi:hypothetical protein
MHWRMRDLVKGNGHKTGRKDQRGVTASPIDLDGG